MAKLVVVYLIYLIAAALTSCSASRPLLTTAASSPSGRTDPATGTSKGASTDMVSTESFVETESGSRLEHEVAQTVPDSEQLVDDLGPCMEDHDESAGVSERPCHRLLADYGSPDTNVNYKTP